MYCKHRTTLDRIRFLNPVYNFAWGAAPSAGCCAKACSQTRRMSLMASMTLFLNRLVDVVSHECLDSMPNLITWFPARSACGRSQVSSCSRPECVQGDN